MLSYHELEPKTGKAGKRFCGSAICAGTDHLLYRAPGAGRDGSFDERHFPAWSSAVTQSRPRQPDTCHDDGPWTGPCHSHTCLCYSDAIRCYCYTCLCYSDAIRCYCYTCLCHSNAIPCYSYTCTCYFYISTCYSFTGSCYSYTRPDQPAVCQHCLCQRFRDPDDFYPGLGYRNTDTSLLCQFRPRSLHPWQRWQ